MPQNSPHGESVAPPKIVVLDPMYNALIADSASNEMQGFDRRRASDPIRGPDAKAARPVEPWQAIGLDDEATLMRL